MKTRPIIFGGRMVRAILSGAKTETRRIVRRMVVDGCVRGVLLSMKEGIARFGDDIPDDPVPVEIHSPYGKTGDRLWVRETWACDDKHLRSFEPGGGGPMAFRADGQAGALMGDGEGGRFFLYHGWIIGTANKNWPGRWWGLNRYGGQWRPSIHMPRWASRITLEVLDVGVQRLQDITRKDIEAEGVWPPIGWRPPLRPDVGLPLIRLGGKHPPTDYLPKGKKLGEFTTDELFRAEWASGWDTINAKRASWEMNPWVWVVRFKRLEPKEDVTFPPTTVYGPGDVSAEFPPRRTR